jgi:hypothetical protein
LRRVARRIGSGDGAVEGYVVHLKALGRSPATIARTGEARVAFHAAMVMR